MRIYLTKDQTTQKYGSFQKVNCSIQSSWVFLTVILEHCYSHTEKCTKTYPAVFVSATWVPPLIFSGVKVISVDPISPPSICPSHKSRTISNPDRCWGLQVRKLNQNINKTCRHVHITNDTGLTVNCISGLVHTEGPRVQSLVSPGRAGKDPHLKLWITVQF